MVRRGRTTDATVDYTRRGYLLATGVTGISAVAGCLGEDEAPDPISIEDDHDCAVCNMVISNHPGPSGHSFYPEDADVPVEDDGVVTFCSSVCAYKYYFEQREAGYEPLALYLTDYSSVDWDVYDEQGLKFVTAHLEAAAHADATGLQFVVESDVLGAMGESLIGFSSSDDAESFADQYGGELFDHDSISRALVEGLGT